MHKFCPKIFLECLQFRWSQRLPSNLLSHLSFRHYSHFLSSFLSSDITLLPFFCLLSVFLPPPLIDFHPFFLSSIHHVLLPLSSLHPSFVHFLNPILHPPIPSVHPAFFPPFSSSSLSSVTPSFPPCVCFFCSLSIYLFTLPCFLTLILQFFQTALSSFIHFYSFLSCNFLSFLSSLPSLLLASFLSNLLPFSSPQSDQVKTLFITRKHGRQKK